MSDPLRHDPGSAADGDSAFDREAKTEQLLLLGLDHYFAGEYDQAIHVWTRVLFLDRGHARARAYIERARGALGERQRESEELLHDGVDAFERGEVDTARRLLRSAVGRGAADDEALSVLDRLDRLQPASAPLSAPPTSRTAPRRPATSAEGAPARRARTKVWLPVALGLAIAASALFALTSWDVLSPWLVGGTATSAPPVVVREEPLPVPSASELAVARARLLLNRGHLRDSLKILDALQPGDALKAEADQLRAAIQRALMTGADPRTAAAPASPLTDRPFPQR